MKKDEIKGKVEQIKGDIKERIGGASKDRSTQAEGFVEGKKGKVRSAVGTLESELEEKEAEHRTERETGSPRAEPEHE